MSEKDKKYHEKLQSYIDKIKELKDWKSRSTDKETTFYLKKAIEKLLSEMNDLVSKKNKN